jgi:hypothetical protein
VHHLKEHDLVAGIPQPLSMTLIVR